MKNITNDATSMLLDIAAGNTTAEKLVQDSINKIKATHAQLNAASEILEADAAGQLRQLPDGPLKGIPISIKECYAMKGKQITSGSKRMTPIQCAVDATVVKRLNDAGAVVVARGNTSEFLLGRETDNLISGTTNNAIDPKLTAGGSSGGDGTLIANGNVAFGIGTDIGGSCRYPAVFNGIVGFKPASGLIDKTGIFPAAGNAFVETLNSPGIMARSVRDIRMVYNIIADKPLQVSAGSHFRLLTSHDFRVKIKDDSISQALNSATDFLKTQSTAIEDVSFPESGSHYKDFVSFITGGFTDKVYEWSVTSGGKKLSFMGELVRRMIGKPTISNELFAMLLPFNMFKPSPSKLEKLAQKITALRESYHAMLGSSGILILPTVGILAPVHKKFIPQYNKPGVIEIITPISFCNVYNLSCITIPAWKFQKNKDTNPPGIQLAAAPGNEALLLHVAELLEGYLQG
jgi:Asp-tRNA(Asn)/Glu-tRNA(Gln) amidotransferase A subunit family amidase